MKRLQTMSMTFAEHLGSEYQDLREWLRVQELLAQAEQDGEVARPFLKQQDDLFYLTNPPDSSLHRTLGRNSLDR